MISDHHGRMAGRATLLVRAVDEIPGTHNRYELQRRQADPDGDGLFH
jgi:hypothetical protein